MKKTIAPFILLILALVVASCHTRYVITDITRTRIVVDERYDAHPDAAAETFVKPYQHEVDSLMMPVVGQVSLYMRAHRPESELSNLLADILLWSGKAYNESPDFSVYNMGGIRAALAKGPVTLGNVNDVAPFDNKIFFLSLTGDKILELFSQIAKRGGEGVSHGVELEISRDGKLIKARLNGEEVDTNKSYRVATLDYLASGNDGLSAFNYKSDVRSPQGADDNVRVLIANYFRDNSGKGLVVDGKVEGRIKVVN